MATAATASDAAIAKEGGVHSEGGALMGRAAVLIWNDVAPEGRAQFYAWHDGEHIPERLSLPGFLRGRRCARAGHSPEWLTIYEAVDVSALMSPAYLARLNAPTAATTRTLAFFRNTSRAVCRRVYSIGSSSGGHVLAMRMSVDPARADAMCRYLRDDALPRALSVTGILAGHLFAADTSASYVDTAESTTRAFDVPAWVLLCEASNADAAEQARAVVASREFARLGVEIREDATVYALEICRISTAAIAPLASEAAR